MSSLTVSLALFLSEKSDTQINSFGAVVLCDNSSYKFKSKIKNQLVGDGYLFNDVKMTVASSTNPVFLRAHVYFESTNEVAKDKIKFNSFSVEDHENYTWSRFGDYWYLCDKSGKFMSINSTKAGEVYVFLNQLDAIVPEMQGVLGEDEFVSCEIVVQSSLASNFSNTTDFSEINKSFDKNATETTKSGTYSVVFKQNGATLSTQTINYGGKATIPEMTIAEGEVFLCWNTREDGSGANITNEQLGYITQNLTLFPIFENQKVLVTVVQSEGGTITPETQMVDWGSDLLLHFTPSKNYVLKRILINGDPVGATSEYLLKRITGSVEVSAEFVSDFIILDINGGNGTQPNVVYNADQTKFKIEEGSEPTKSGKEFYYYSTNSADNEQGQNGVRYDIGRWYDVPNTSGSSTLYAIYLTPTNNYTTAQNYIVVPKSVTTIADCTTNMFSATNSTVKFVTFPLQTKSLGKKILASCSALKGVSMSDYVSTIGEGAFLGDNSLEKIVIPQDLNGIGKQAFKNCSLLSQVTGLQSCLLTQISDSCFENCSKLTEVVLPSTIVLIGSGAFNSSGIAKINLKDTKITQIGASAFKSCSSLSSVYLPSTVQSIGQEAFSLSGLTELKNFAGTSVEVISSQTFLGTPLVGIELPQTLTRIDNQAFGECSELKIVGGLANTVVTMIDSSAFAGCEKLVGMIFPQTLLTLGDSAFEGCLGLVNVVFDSSLIQIGERCFNGCENLSTLGNFVDTQVESIGDAAFKDCASLSDVSLPSTIQSIGDRSFENCSALATITFINGDNLSTLNVASNTFNGTTSTLKVNILDEAHFDAYITKLNGKGFAENAFMFFLGNIDRKAFYKNGVWEKFRDAVITSIAGDHGTISPSGAVVYSLGSSANYVISPETGYKIKSILIDGVEIAITAADGNSQSYQFDDIQKDHTISATFEQRMFKISVVCGENGTIDPNFSEDYAYGSNVTYIITPNNGYVIKDVFIDGLSNAKAREDSKYTFSNIHAPHEIEVVFEVVTYTIVCSVGEGGSMSPNASLVTKNWGESYAITFTPNTNYVISNVIIDGDALNLSGVDLSKAYKYTFTNIRANHVISCLFETTIRTLTFDPNGGQFSDGSTNMMKTLSYDSIIGTLPTATREGYIFRGWNTRIDTTETIDYSTKKYSDVFGKEDGWLYAIYEVKTFTISTSANGYGTITGSVIVDWGSITTIEMTPDKGYRVASYSIDGGAAINSTVQAGKSDYYTFSNITANHSIVATFVPITYQVKYNGNGATSGSMSNSTHTYDEEKQLTANSYSKTGYSFAGWTKSADGAGTIYANKEKVKNLSETQGSVVDLYAKWTANTYTATFNANGGTVSPTTKSVTYNSAYGSLPTPTRAGYTFVCWTNSLFNMCDYLAKWNGSTNQGTASVNRPNNEFTLTATGSDCYTNPWNGASYRIQVSPSTTYLFSWKQNTQTSNVNNFVFLYDSSTASSYTTAYSNESYDSATGRYYISFTTASTTNYVGFRFGIVSASGTSLTFSEVKLEEKPSISDFALGAYATESTTIVNMPKDHTLYAQWTANTYTITWNAIDASLIANLWNYAGSTGYTSSNSGSNSAYSEKTAKTPKSNVIYDGTISYFSPIPNRLGYTFNGWFTASSGGTKVANADGTFALTNNIWNISGNTTLYAQWTKNTYTISYDYAGGTKGTNAPTSYSFGTSTAISNPTRTGYTFAGWKVTSTLSGKQSGTINNGNGTLQYDANYPNAVYFALFYQVANVSYTGVAQSNTSGQGAQIRWRQYNTSGTYKGNGSSSTTYSSTTTTFTSIWYHLGSSQTTTTISWDQAKDYSVSANQVGNLTLVAKWTANTYTVTFNPNNGNFLSRSSLTMAASSGNYNYSANMVSGKISQNTTYSLKFGTATCTAGGATQFSVLIYDFTASAVRAQTTVSFGSNVTATLTTDGNLIEANDNRLIIYAGVAGATAGVAASYQNITLSVSKSVTYDSNYGTLPTPTKTGYTFAGWSKNFFDPYFAYGYSTTCTRSGETFTFDTGSTNTGSLAFQVQTWKDSSYIAAVLGTSSTGVVSGVFTKDSTINKLRLKYNGNKADAHFYYDISNLPDGDYVIQVNVTTMQMNKIVINNVMIEQNSSNARTSYVSASTHITSSSVVNDAVNRTLFAHWTPNEYTVTFDPNCRGGRMSEVSSDATYTGNNLTINYYTSTHKFKLTNTSSSDPFATIGATVYLTANTTYLMHMKIYDSSDSAKLSNGSVQVFYGINSAYSETNSRRFNYSTEYQTFTVSTTGTYNIRIDNDCGQTAYIREFWIIENFQYQKTVKYGETYGTLPTGLSATCGTFVGWNSAISGGTQVTSSTIVTTAGDHTIYGSWAGLLTINVNSSSYYSNVQYSTTSGLSGSISNGGSASLSNVPSTDNITITATVSGYYMDCFNAELQYYGIRLNNSIQYSSYNSSGYDGSVSVSMSVKDINLITVSSCTKRESMCCVTGDSMVAMADGTTKQIKDIVAGDKIMSYNFETKQLEPTAVDHLTKLKRTQIVHIKFADGTMLKITPDHPMFSERGWICYDTAAGKSHYFEVELQENGTQIGDWLLSLSLMFDKEIVGIEYFENTNIDVYTLTAAENHNYFVQSVLVHNKPCAILCCVDGETNITMADGSHKTAKDISVGDEILSYNQETKRYETTKVEEVITPNRESILEITLNDGTMIKITDDHPMLSERGWICYNPELGQIAYRKYGVSDEAMHVGDKIFTQNELKTISLIKVINFENPQMVYTFKLANGKAFLANGNIVASAQ